VHYLYRQVIELPHEPRKSNTVSSIKRHLLPQNAAWQGLSWQVWSIFAYDILRSSLAKIYQSIAVLPFIALEYYCCNSELRMFATVSLLLGSLRSVMSTISGTVDEAGQKSLIGETIDNLPTPSILLDREIMKRHCRTLPAAAESLGLDFRFHVKSHKVRAQST
jgi:hypothetical protein